MCQNQEMLELEKQLFVKKLVKDWASEEIPTDCSFPKFELVLLLKCQEKY